jgi:hypothetical protein
MTEKDPWVHPPLYSERLNAELGQYLGPYVAIDDTRDHVVASGSDGVEVFKRARALGVNDPLLLDVPAHPEYEFIGVETHVEPA